MRRLRLLLCLAVTALLVGAPAQASEPVTGGAVIPDKLVIESAVCAGGQAWACAQGQRLTLSGAGMDGVKMVEFLGKHGSKDDRRARPLRLASDELVVIVPHGANSGKLRAQSMTSGAVTAPRNVRITGHAHAANAEAELPEAIADGVFPIRGKHDMGATATNRFGGGRGHQGQDLFADCGTPLVAVRDASVQFAGRHSAAGNYLVLQDEQGQSYAYMHMKAKALVDKGDHVVAGQPVGYIGDTGRATECHLHFEIWTAPGWRTGGHAIDPLPQLKRWEAADGGHR